MQRNPNIHRVITVLARQNSGDIFAKFRAYFAAMT
jgi:hypothetical protein